MEDAGCPDTLTVKELKRYLAAHKLQVSGKKELLVRRYNKHRQRQLGNQAQHPPTQEISDSLKVPADLNWTADLSTCPPLTHESISIYKVSDRHLQEGYRLFTSKKVENVLVASQDGRFYCKGRVSPSMKSLRYTVEVMCVGREIVAVNCSCPVGGAKCKHTVALMYSLVGFILEGLARIPEDLACTSKPCQWKRVSARPVLTNVDSFTALAPKAVNADPDNPEAAKRHQSRVEKRLCYSSVPWEQPQTMHPRQQANFVQSHPFWASIVREKFGDAAQETKATLDDR